jgi:hypothetical protein
VGKCDRLHSKRISTNVRLCKRGWIHALPAELLRVSPTRGSVPAMNEKMAYLKDGWVVWSTGSELEGLVVYAQTNSDRVSGERGDLTTLVVTGRSLTTDRLRQVPVARIEALSITNPDFSPKLEGSEDGPVTKGLKDLRKAASQEMMNEAYRKANAPRKPLTRPDGTNPDAFYQQVADAYREVLQTTNKVAVVLAKEAEVPVGTAHRWILEARRRGFLPAARQGRAG